MRNEVQALQQRILSGVCIWNQKSYQLACISTHLDLTIEREKGTYLSLPILSGRTPLQTMLKMSVGYTVIDLSCISLSPRQTGRNLGLRPQHCWAPGPGPASWKATKSASTSNMSSSFSSLPPGLLPPRSEGTMKSYCGRKGGEGESPPNYMV